MYKAAAFILGYCFAAIVSSNVTFYVPDTEWLSVWTWIVLVFWWGVGAFALVPVLAAMFFGTGLTGLLGLLGVAKLIDLWKGR